MVKPLALPFLLAAGSLLAALAVLLRPPVSGPVAAVYPPWWGAARSVQAAAAGGLIVRLGAVPFVVVVAAPDRSALRRAGAWLVLDPQALGGCAAEPNQRRQSDA